MISALVSAMAASVVLMTATLRARRASWRKAHVWMVYVSSIMIVTFVATHLTAIDRPWMAFVTVAFVVKSLSMLAMLMDKSRNPAPEVANDGADRGNGVRALGCLCNSLAAGVPASLVVGAEEEPAVGKGGEAE